ncbi:MAG: DUF3332 domain-containing protein [Myxococcales bacterium]|nr:DUF3332 domain-containing protein [Myxococcales bacterium]
MTPLRPMRRQLLLAAGLSLLSGCFGKFAATNALYDWNKGVSSNKWLRWLVFLVLIVLPVYSIFIFVDAIVLNTIEFWTGSNPLGGGHASIDDHHTLHSSRTDDPDVIRHELRKDGKLVRVLHVRRVGEHGMELLDEDMKPLASARSRGKDTVEVVDADGRRQSHLDSQQLDRLALALEAGLGPCQAMLESGAAADDPRLAQLRR